MVAEVVFSMRPEDISKGVLFESLEFEGTNAGNPVSFRDQLTALYDFVREKKFSNTLEVGFGIGGSAVHIMAATGKKHVAMDPVQKLAFNNLGLENVHKFGFEKKLVFYNEYSEYVLPELHKQGLRFDFIYIDGDHKFDFTLMDFFLSDRILEENGYILLDDTWMPSVKRVADFIRLNRREYDFCEPIYKDAVLIKKTCMEDNAKKIFRNFTVGVPTIPDPGRGSLDENSSISFAELHFGNKISTGVDIRVHQDVVSGEKFIFAGFNGSRGYNFDFLNIKFPLREEFKTCLFSHITFEIALSSEFSPKEGWMELKTEVITKNDSRYLELNSYDLKVLVAKKWTKVEYAFPRQIRGDEIIMIRIVLNSKNDLEGGLFFKDFCLNKILLDLSPDVKKIDNGNKHPIWNFISVKKLNQFTDENNIHKALILAKDPEVLKQEWEECPGKNAISYMIKNVEESDLGKKRRENDSLWEFSKESKRHDYRHLLEFYDENSNYWKQWCDEPITIEKILNSRGFDEKVKQLTDNVDLALIQGASLFEEFYVNLHYLSSMVKKDGFLVIFDSALPATFKAMEYFDKNRSEEFCRLTTKKFDCEYVVWKRTKYYDPRPWDYYIDF